MSGGYDGQEEGQATEDRLKELGDPSGQQTSEYWDEWFNIVCSEKNHRSFEWYVDTSEVLRMLKHHLPKKNDESTRETGELPYMIHAGSGNSLLPVQVRDDFTFPHRHVVVDISEVALDEMRRMHDTNGHMIEYMRGNLLEPPLPLESSKFEVWIDKGLLDALFKDDGPKSSDQCQVLFDEAHRLLAPEAGFAVVVSMAEDHSLRLILNTWLDHDKVDSCRRKWLSTLHLWELTPVSGRMRPFGFVLTKEKDDMTEQVVSDGLFLVLHTARGACERISLDSDDPQSVLTEVERIIRKLQENFKQEAPPQLLLATLEVKPWSTDDDLDEIGEIITTATWTAMGEDGAPGRTLEPQWQLFRDDSSSQASKTKIAPVGFGISKLVLKCIIPSDDVDHLVTAISEWEGGGKIEDGVQSVDVNWSNTFPIGNAATLM